MKYDIWALYIATVTKLCHVTNHYHLVWLYDEWKTCNENGALVLCTLEDFNDTLNTMDDDAIALINDVYIGKEFVEDDKTKTNVIFYSSRHSNSLDCIKTRLNAIFNKLRRIIYKVICKDSKNSTTNYIFMQNDLQSRPGMALSQSKGTIHVDWVLLGS